MNGLYKYLYLLLFLFSSNVFLAKNTTPIDKNNFYAGFKLDLETTTCTDKVNKDEILNKEFSNTKFQLDLNKNLLIINRNNEANSKLIEFSINNSQLIFKDQEEYGKVEAYLIYVNELPVLRFKDHSDDCFFFVVNFSK